MNHTAQFINSLHSRSTWENPTILKSQKSSSSTLSFAFVRPSVLQHLSISTNVLPSKAKEERKLYTLDPISNAATTPPPVPNVVAPPVPNPPQASRTTGPTRTKRTSTQARMQTGPVPPALKARIPKKVPNKTSAARKSQANGTQPDANESHAVVTRSRIAAQPTVAEFIEPTQPAQPAQSTLTSGSPDGQHPPPSSQLSEGDVPDDVSYTSTLPEVFDGDMDDSAPPATGPWVITDHLTGEMIVDDDEGNATMPTVLSDSVIQVEINPTLGIPVLIETPPPALLFQDTDERPQWLISSINNCLQYAPYYMCLSKVVDLFLAQEARLDYPAKVNRFRCSSHIQPLTAITVSTRCSAIEQSACRSRRVYEIRP